MPPPPIAPAHEDTPPPIRLTHSTPTLGAMSVDRSFLTLGLDIAEQALLDVIARDNLHLRPEKMPRRRRARANGRLKQIEHIIGRMMALAEDIPNILPQ